MGGTRSGEAVSVVRCYGTGDSVNVKFEARELSIDFSSACKIRWSFRFPLSCWAFQISVLFLLSVGFYRALRILTQASASII